MKTAILTEAGKTTGLGHLSRAIALSDAFDTSNICVQIQIKSDFAKIPVFKKKNLVLSDWLDNNKVLLSICQLYDVVIIDSYLADKKIYSIISKHARMAVYIDDYNRIDYPAGIVVNPTPGGELINYSPLPSLDYLVGNKYVLLRKEYWQSPKRIFRDELKSVLLLTGGMDVNNLMPSVIRSLNRYFPNLEKKLIVNRWYKNINQIRSLVNPKTVIIESPSAEEIVNLVNSCDIAITAAGQTLHELAATGTPTIAIGIADNQKYNLIGYERAGFLCDLIWQRDAGFDHKLRSSVMEFRHKSARMKKSAIGRRLVDGKGGRRIVDFIIKRLR